MAQIYSLNCNSIFEAETNEHGYTDLVVDIKNSHQVYSQFGPTNDKAQCINQTCSEYKWVRTANSLGFRGINSRYPAGRGYVVDLDSDSEKTFESLGKLKAANWID